MKILLLRHGETEWNRQHRLQGRSDIPLNDVGLAEARKAARNLETRDFDLAITSPLARARKTAEIILKGRDVELRESPLLLEMNFGSGEGADLSEEAAGEELIRAEKLRDFFRNPEGNPPMEGGETLGEIKARAAAFLQELKSMEGSYESLLLVAHGGIIRGILSVLRGTPDGEFWQGKLTPNCGAEELELRDGIITAGESINLVDAQDVSMV
jgi:broad specificity phosphatase PhoE